MRNALIASGGEGWENKAPIPTRELTERLGEINLGLRQIMRARMLAERVPEATRTGDASGRLAPRLRALDERRLTILMQAKRTRTVRGRLDEVTRAP